MLRRSSTFHRSSPFLQMPRHTDGLSGIDFGTVFRERKPFPRLCMKMFPLDVYGVPGAITVTSAGHDGKYAWNSYVHELLAGLSITCGSSQLCGYHKVLRRDIRCS